MQTPSDVPLVPEIPVTTPFARRLAPIAFALALVTVAPQGTMAQAVFDAKTAGQVRTAYLTELDTLHAKFVALANAIPADKYSWRPAPGVRSISEALMHVVSEYYFYVPMSVDEAPPADFGVPRETLPKLEKITGKAEVIAELDKSWAHAKARVSASDLSKMSGKFGRFKASIDEAAFSMTGDLHEHMGQLIAYARSVGVKPPWSK